MKGWIRWEGFGRTTGGPWARCIGGFFDGRIEEIRGIVLVVPYVTTVRDCETNFPRVVLREQLYVPIKGQRPGEYIYQVEERSDQANN